MWPFSKLIRAHTIGYHEFELSEQRGRYIYFRFHKNRLIEKALFDSKMDAVCHYGAEVAEQLAAEKEFKKYKRHRG